MFSYSARCCFIVTSVTNFSAVRDATAARKSPAAAIAIHFDQLKGPVTHNAAGLLHPFL
jgi:hypothetical protein